MPILQIPISKAGKAVTVSVDTAFLNDLGDEQMNLVIYEGLKVIMNSRASKLPAPSKLEGADLEAAKQAAINKANENLQMLKDGKLEIKSAGSSAKASAPRNVMTEARRIAKEIMKNQLRANGITISHVEPKVITAAANKMLDGPSGPEIIEQATKNVAEREAKTPKLDLKALGIEVSPKLVAKAEKAKAERKSVLSATQAGKVKSRKAKGDQVAAH